MTSSDTITNKFTDQVGDLRYNNLCHLKELRIDCRLYFGMCVIREFFI